MYQDAGVDGAAVGSTPLYNVPPVAITVMTPSNNSQIFQSPVYTRPERPSIVGTGARGVEWLTRIQMALRSGIPSEVNWAITALLEVSFRTPDTVKDKVSREVLPLVVRYVNERWHEVAHSGLYGQETVDNIGVRGSVAEALLALRNLCLDAEMSKILGRDPGCRTMVEKGLNLPDVPSFAEIRSYCLEISEHISIYLPPDGVGPQFFRKIMALLDSDDRTKLISAQRTLSRLSVYDEKNVILDITISQLHSVLRNLLVDDEELISAALDLLYQYTARIHHIDELAYAPGSTDVSNDALWVRDILSTHLIRLLTYKISKERPDYVRLPRRTKRPAPAEPPKLTDTILQELLALSEPDRATNWIRSSYEPDPDGEVTQISLWKAYESQFEPYVRQGRRLLPAVDFIKNVTSAFRNAAAMVVNLSNGQKKFIIKGIKPRESPVSPTVYNKINSEVLPDSKRRGPPAFGPAAVLVLQNVARLQGGRALLRSKISSIVEATALNPSILTYVDGLLALLDVQS